MSSRDTEGSPDIGRRLKAIRDQLGLNQADFARKVGVAQSSVSRIEKGERPLSIELIKGLLCQFAEVDVRTLLCGVAASHNSSASALEVAARVRPVIRAAADSLDDLPQQGIADDYLAVPLVEGRVAAGHGGVVWEQVQSLVWVYRPALGRRHRLIAVRVGGDSMEPTVPDGAIIIIDRDCREPKGRRRAIWALRTADGECQIKRLLFASDDDPKRDVWLVVSDNPEYAPKIAWTGDFKNLIIGQVIWMWRSLI